MLISLLNSANVPFWHKAKITNRIHNLPQWRAKEERKAGSIPVSLKIHKRLRVCCMFCMALLLYALFLIWATYQNKPSFVYFFLFQIQKQVIFCFLILIWKSMSPCYSLRVSCRTERHKSSIFLSAIRLQSIRLGHPKSESTHLKRPN